MSPLESKVTSDTIGCGLDTIPCEPGQVTSSHGFQLAEKGGGRKVAPRAYPLSAVSNAGAASKVPASGE
jgi:hypothetical protein